LLLSKAQQKNLTLVLCFFSDITLVAWLYFQASNYNQYTKIAGKVMDSPDFQNQIYAIILQSLTFTLLLFLVAQSIVYILAWRKFRSAFLYLKFFAVGCFAISMYITIMSSSFAFLPMIIYLMGYYIFSREFKEITVELQKRSL
jgi:hypothetical protein